MLDSLKISVDDYNTLRLTTGWVAIEPDQAKADILNQVFTHYQ